MSRLGSAVRVPRVPFLLVFILGLASVSILAPAPSLAQSRPVGVSAGVMAGQILTKVAPQYPAIAKAARVQGTVVLQAVISKQGTIEDLKVIDGPPLLQQAALDAVKRWTYKPYMLNGEPVEVATMVNVIFSLGETAPPQPASQQIAAPATQQASSPPATPGGGASGFGQGNPTFKPSAVLTADSLMAAYAVDMNTLRGRSAAGDVAAEYVLGSVLLRGIKSLPQDTVQGQALLDKVIAIVRPAADGGDSYSQVIMGDIYQRGTGVPIDLATAAGWYAKAAAKNDPDGLGRLAYANLSGRGVPKDVDRARDLYRKAADTGNARSEESFGLDYLGPKYTGDDEFPTDYAQAMVWLKKAADQGDLNAMDWIGVIYRDGLGVPQDYAAAAKWYRRAADQNWRFSEVKLADCYLHGRGVPQDNRQAMFWYRKAADQGDPNAEEWVGSFYRDGTGVPVDFAQARAWFQKSADSGRQNGKTLLADLDALIATQRAQTTQQLVQLMGQAHWERPYAQVAAEERIGPNDTSLQNGQYVTGSDALQIDASGCNATASSLDTQGQLRDPNSWSLHERVDISVRPYERSSLALLTLGKRDWVITSVNPEITVLTIRSTEKETYVVEWLFEDANQAKTAAGLVKQAVEHCGGVVHDEQDAELQAKIDKALKKAGKPHTDWGGIFSAAVTAMAPVTDSMDPNAIQNAANQQTANIQAAQARAAAAQAQAAQEAAQRAAAQQQAAQQQAAAQAEAQRASARQLADQQQAAAQQPACTDTPAWQTGHPPTCPAMNGGPGSQVPGVNSCIALTNNSDGTFNYQNTCNFTIRFYWTPKTPGPGQYLEQNGYLGPGQSGTSAFAPNGDGYSFYACPDGYLVEGPDMRVITRYVTGFYCVKP